MWSAKVCSVLVLQLHPDAVPDGNNDDDYDDDDDILPVCKCTRNYFKFYLLWHLIDLILIFN